MSVFKFGSIRSPPRRPTVQGSEQSPFCTSPSQLQEVTLDPNTTDNNGTIPFSMGVRSPGKSSPIRGRTMKEYEEQLSQLKKENFNLKLRIYFLEERMGHMSEADDKEDPIKKTIELKVEAETLRKEVSDKQDLLCQAAKALDLIEEQHQAELKKLRNEKEAEKVAMKSRIKELEDDIKDIETKTSSSLIIEALGIPSSTTCVNHHTHEEVEKLQQQIEELETQVQQLECSLQEETMRSNQLEADLQEIQQDSERVAVRCQGLELELKQRNSKLEDLVQELEQKAEDLAGCNLRIRTLEEALSAKEPEIQIKIQELCERDRIIEEKQSQIEQQNKVLVEIQITLDEKQRQIEALRSSLSARDSSIADLESRLAKSKANSRNLEAKLDASLHEANRLREEVETLKAQQKRSNTRSREHFQHERELLSPIRKKSSNNHMRKVEEKSPPRRTPGGEDDFPARRKFQEKEEKLKVIEEKYRETKLQLEGTKRNSKSSEDKIRQLQIELKETVSRLQDSEKQLQENSTASSKLEYDHRKACHAIKSFMKQSKDRDREMDQMRLDMKKRDHRIQDLMSELSELRESCNKANWEVRQLQAQAHVQGGGGMPGAFEDVHDMTEEENERLWAEVEDKNKKLAQLTKERDNLSIEMEKQVQALITSLKEKESLLEEYERKVSTYSDDLSIRDNRIRELEDDLKRLKNELELLRTDTEKNDQEKSLVCSEKGELPSEGLKLELEDKKREVERLNGELRKRTNNLQELVNKELWDKNREIEKLQDRLNNVCERKELEIMALQQQVGARDFQLKMLQDKVAELGIHVNLPTSLMLRELQQVPVTLNQHIHFQQSLITNEDNLRLDLSEVSREEFGPLAPSNETVSKDDVLALRDQLQASVEDRKYLCRTVEELREKLRNTPERDSDSRALRSECVRLREEVDRANVWKKEAGEACALLTRRLEELARFLSSLLRHPEQLGGLGIKHRQMINQAVERSMELSRTLSVSLSANNQDLSNTSLLPLMDSFSSIIISASDINLNFSDILRLCDDDMDETSSYEPEHQDNFRKSASDAALLSNNQYCRSNGNNSEIQIKELTSDENFMSNVKTVEEQALIIAQLQSQVEILTNEIKQRDKIFKKSELKSDVSMPLFSSPRSGSSTPSKSSNANSSRKSKIEKMDDAEDKEESLNSMTFYNSQHLGGNICDQWDVDAQTTVPEENSISSSIKYLQDGINVCQEKQLMTSRDGTRRSISSPGKSLPIAENSSMPVTGETGWPLLMKQDHSKSTKSPVSFKLSQSSSTNAVSVSQAQQSVQHHDLACGSLSESEAWSEPDRNVSLARIGLNEESAKVVLSPGTPANGSLINNSRSRNGRVIQEEAETSESSEETAHEISRIQGKRSRSDVGEVRRLQNRLRALEQLNDALRAELTIMHQLNPPASPQLPSSPAEVNDKPPTHDISINTTTSEGNIQKSELANNKEDEENGNSLSVTIPAHLLDQIRYQREKLESSLYHNDFIRRQLEGIMSSFSSQDDDNMMNLWQKLKESTEQLEETRHQSQELEKRLQDTEVQLENSKEQARLASEANELLQVTRQTMFSIQEKVSSLEAQLQEKDNEILEKKCQMLELENQAKQQSIETERILQESVKIKEDAEKQIIEAEQTKKNAENKLKEAEKLMIEAERIKIDSQNKIEMIEMQFRDAEIQSDKVNSEKEIIQREYIKLQKDKEEMEISKEEIKKQREQILNEKESFEREKHRMRKEMEENIREIKSIADDAKKQKEEAEKEIKMAKKEIHESELRKQEAERKIKAAEEMVIMVEKHSKETLQIKLKEMEVQYSLQLHEARKMLEEKEWMNKAEMEKKVIEAERLGQEFETGLKRQIEDIEKRGKEIRAEANMRIKDVEEKSKEREMELKKRLQESERQHRDTTSELRKQLDEITLSTSQAALERTRLANEKLRLEKEIRRHEAREVELIHETKEAENCLLVTKDQLDKEISVLQQQKSDLERCVKELEAANIELKERMQNLHIHYHQHSENASTEQTSENGHDPLTHMKIGTSHGSFSSGLDFLTGDGGSLPYSPWGTTGTVSLEYSGSQTEEREHYKDKNRRGSDGGRSGGLAVSSLVLQHGFGRQRSELSDYMSEDQAIEEYETVFTQTRSSSSYWVTTLTEQHSTPSTNVPGDPSLMRNINSSPDLGIESDQGRFSSLEAASSGVHIDSSKILRTMEGNSSDLDHTVTTISLNSKGDTCAKSYKELEQENILLKRRLTRTHRALEETLAHLTAANQRKKQVERAICKQLHKTHHILKRARVNLDPEVTDFNNPSVHMD